MGSLYKRGDVWWTKVYLYGSPCRQSTHTRDEAVARAVLTERETAAGDVPQAVLDAAGIVRAFLRLNNLSAIVRRRSLTTRKLVDRRFGGKAPSRVQQLHKALMRFDAYRRTQSGHPDSPHALYGATKRRAPSWKA